MSPLRHTMDTHNSTVKLPTSDDIPSASPEKAEPVKRLRSNNYAMACAMLACMAAIISGYDISVMSGASDFLKEDLKINDTEIEVLAGIINLYSLVGSLAAGRISDRIGRRYTIVFAAVIFIVGAFLMALAPNYAVLMAARFVAGVGVGFAATIAPVYTSEIAPTASRGFLTSFFEVFANFGILLGYVSNFAFAGLPKHINWRLMFAAGGIPPVFLAFSILVMPESPRWLVLQGRLGEAKRVLERVSDTPEEAEIRLLEIKEAVGIPPECMEEMVNVPRNSHGHGVWKELILHPTPTVRRILLAAIGLQFFQQASGIDSVVLYSPRIFAKAGLTSDREKLGATVAVGLTKTSFILIATFLLDRVGRRPLLLSSSGAMIVSLVLLASGMGVIDRNPEQKLDWAVGLCIASVLSFVASFSIGLGPIAWVYSSEIFPLRLRAQGVSLGCGTNRIMSGVITMTFLSLYKAITLAGSFYLYAGVAAIGWAFFYVFLPETRGRSLEEMEALFGKNRGDAIKENEVEFSQSGK